MSAKLACMPGDLFRAAPSKAGLPRMDMVDALRYFGALALVLALVGAAGLAIRRYGLPGIAGAGRRLAVVDSLMLSRTHRVVILRCDGIEHVLVTGPQGASVVPVSPVKFPAEPTAPTQEGLAA
jgi:flagellar protein FliO/FliZ